MVFEHLTPGNRWRGASGEHQFLRSQRDGYASNDRADPLTFGDFDIGATEECRFEIFRKDEERMTSTLFSGGDWRWQLVTTSGLILAEASGYPNEHSCRSAVAILQRRAADAPVIARRSAQP